MNKQEIRQVVEDAAAERIDEIRATTWSVDVKSSRVNEAVKTSDAIWRALSKVI
jgi:hypothetical protein